MIRKYRKWLIGIGLLLSPVVLLMGWVAWEVNQPQEDRHFVLGGKKWVVPKEYLVILDSASSPGYFETQFEYPDMSPGNPNKFGNNNRIRVVVRTQSEIGGGSKNTQERIKNKPSTILLERKNGFNVYRSRLNQGLYNIYWFKQDESEYSMYITVVDHPKFQAYTVFRSFGKSMELQYSAKKVYMSDFEEIDKKITNRLRSFIQD